MKEFDLMYGCLGNGIAVYDKKQIVGKHDYKAIAHITVKGEITYRDQHLPDQVKKEITAYSESLEFLHLGYAIRLYAYSITQGIFFILHPLTRWEIGRFSMEHRNAGPQHYLLNREEIKEQVGRYFQDRNQTLWAEHYPELRSKWKESLLLIRDEIHYKAFDRDANFASQVLSLDLQQLPIGDNEQVPLIEFPHSALDENLPRLVRAGAKVAIEDYNPLPF